MTEVEVVECPECGAPVQPEEDDLAIGDCVVCDQCDEVLAVVGVDPLVLTLDEDGDEDVDDIDDDICEDDDGDEDDFHDDDEEDY